MKTTNNTLNLTAMRIGFPLCLALTCFSGSAAAWGTHGSVNPATCDANGNCTSDTPMGVGPGPSLSGGTPLNPADYGMCGVLHMAGTFDNSTIAHFIIGADHYYHFDLQYKGTPATEPQIELTCIRFSDFTGLPPDYTSTLRTFEPTPLNATGGAKKTEMIGTGGEEACIWAGLAGSLSSPDRTAIYAYAQNDFSTSTLASVKSAPKTSMTSYAFCNGIPGISSWVPYVNDPPVPALTNTKGLRYNVPFPVPGGKNPGVKSDRWWCYMQGVGTAPGTGTSATETFSFAGLAYLTSDTYEWNVGGESALWYNCIGLDQNPPTL